MSRSRRLERRSIPTASSARICSNAPAPPWTCTATRSAAATACIWSISRSSRARTASTRSIWKAAGSRPIAPATGAARTRRIQAMRSSSQTARTAICRPSAPTPRRAPAGAASRDRTSCWTGWSIPTIWRANGPSSSTAPTTPIPPSWRARASWAAPTAASPCPTPTWSPCANGWAKGGCCSP